MRKGLSPKGGDKMNGIARPLLGKVVLRGILRAKTGLHIGASKEALEIGALDLPVIRNPANREPYVPGTSLKGKMRSLFERKEGKDLRRKMDDKGEIHIHACDKKEDAFKCHVCRLFGSTGLDRKTRETIKPGSIFLERLKVSDAFLTGYTRKYLEQMEEGLLFTEIKFENVLDRITAAAMPRQVERVPPGSDFVFEFVYDVEEPAHVKDDLENLLSVMKLVEEDALGGHGSRGSGQVSFCVMEFAGKKAESYWDKRDGTVIEAIKKDLPLNLDEATELPRPSEAKAQIENLVALFPSKS